MLPYLQCRILPTRQGTAGITTDGGAIGKLQAHREMLGFQQLDAVAMDAPDYYEILGVPRNASNKKITGAYRALAREFDPGQNEGGGDPSEFKAINEAYQVLADPHQRGRYDRTVGARQLASVTPPEGAGRAKRSEEAGLQEILDDLFDKVRAGDNESANMMWRYGLCLVAEMDSLGSMRLVRERLGPLPSDEFNTRLE